MSSPVALRYLGAWTFRRAETAEMSIPGPHTPDTVLRFSEAKSEAVYTISRETAKKSRIRPFRGSKAVNRLKPQQSQERVNGSWKNY